MVSLGHNELSDFCLDQDNGSNVCHLRIMASDIEHFAQQFVQSNNKEHIKTPHHGLCEGKPEIMKEFPCQYVIMAHHFKNISLKENT